MSLVPESRLRLFHAPAALFAAAFLVVIAATATLAGPVVLRVGNPRSDSFSFVPLAIGQDLGIFAKNGIKLDIHTFDGSAALEEALAKGTVEIALGSGTEFAFIPKGAPDKAVAALAVKPSLLVITARADTGIARVRDLQGRSIGVDASDPLPAWLVRTLSEDRGWGPEGIKALPLTEALISDGKMNTSVDGVVADLPAALTVEAAGTGKTVVNFGDVVKDFPFYVAFARNDLIANDQDAIKNFLTAWFSTVKWMQDHRKDAIARAATAIGASPETTAKLYDKLMPAYSPDGKFDPKALKTLAGALVQMGVLDRERDLGQYVKQDIMGAGCSNR